MTLENSPYLHCYDLAETWIEGQKQVTMFRVNEAFINTKLAPLKTALPLEWVYYDAAALAALSIDALIGRLKDGWLWQPYKNRHDKVSLVEAAIIDAARRWQEACWFMDIRALRKSYPNPYLNRPHLYAPGALIIAARPLIQQQAFTRLYCDEQGNTVYAEMAFDTGTVGPDGVSTRPWEYCETQRPNEFANLHYSLLGVATHEMGHILGLAHNDNTKSPMGRDSCGYNEEQRLPTDEDAAALEKLWLD